MINLTSSWRALLIPLALLTALSLTGCTTNDPQTRLNAAAARQAEASLVSKALDAGGRRSEAPADCKKWQKSGVVLGDRLDIALAKTDDALLQANRRVQRCAEWHETNRPQ